MPEANKKLGFNWQWLNPVAWHLQSLMRDASKRLIILYGGSSSGKSYSVAQTLLMMTMFTAENSLVLRKVGASISKSIYEDFKVASRQIEAANFFKFKDSVKRIECTINGAHIDFAGLDDPEKIKGISNYRWVFMDEWNEFDEADFKQMRKRLRGKVGQQIITAFNPIKETHWIKTSVFDLETWVDMPCDVVDGKRSPLFKVKSVRVNAPKPIVDVRTKEVVEHPSDTVVIQSTYLNNFWVVGSPDGTYGYYDEQCVADFEKDRVNDPVYYQVYALGEWGVIRTGSEFFGSFNAGVHVVEASVDPELPLHVSVDSNVLPYITITAWQIDLSQGKRLTEVFEICAGNPNNTVRKSAKLLSEKLGEIGYSLPIHLHGDASTRAANNIDEQKRSFLDLFISTLEGDGWGVVDKVGAKNPSVQMSGEFINAVLEGLIDGLSIEIGSQCKESIEDFQSVQKDDNGGILKTRVKNKITMQTYEEHGHASDTFRYVACDLMRDEFIAYSNKRKRSSFNGAIQFYNPETEAQYSQEMVYAMPNIGGKFAMVYGGKCGEKWHVREVAFIDTDSVDEIRERLVGIGCRTNVIECGKPYYPFVRSLRSTTSLQIRVLPEFANLEARIAAASDLVRTRVLFRETEDEEYSRFLSGVLDYTRGGDGKEAAAVLSGFIVCAEKLFGKPHESAC